MLANEHILCKKMINGTFEPFNLDSRKLKVKLKQEFKGNGNNVHLDTSTKTQRTQHELTSFLVRPSQKLLPHPKVFEFLLPSPIIRPPSFVPLQP